MMIVIPIIIIGLVIVLTKSSKRNSNLSSQNQETVDQRTVKGISKGQINNQCYDRCPK